MCYSICELEDYLSISEATIHDHRLKVGYEERISSPLFMRSKSNKL